MDLKGIVSITGMSGLYKSVAQRGDGMVVTSLETKETKFVPTRTHHFATLDGISIFTNDGESKELKDIFAEMQKQEATNSPPDANSNNGVLKKYFKSILPDYDESKVYASDIKKTIKWHQILKKENLLSEEEEKSKEENLKI